MTKLLTLSISETWGNNYKIVTYNLDANMFVVLEIDQSEFRNPISKEVYWDLFGVTYIEKYKYTRDEFHRPIGTPKLIEYYDRKKMVSFFEKYKMSAKRFIKGRFDYGIIKVDQVADIKDPYLIFISDNNSEERITLKNKDYRWVKYWENINREQHEAKVKQWVQYINQEKNHTYLLLYHRKQFTNTRTNKWIVGFYCL